MMYKIALCPHREVCVYGKEDGDASLKEHETRREFISAYQVHGNEVCVVGGEHTLFGKQSRDADALFTTEGKPLGVYVADCLPIVLVGKEACAIVHCSWKTLYTGLLQNTLELFHHHDEAVVAVYLGPSIKHYEVGKEFDQYFPKSFLCPYRDRYLFDMPSCAMSVLVDRGIDREAIVVDTGCTRTDTEKYRGYRRGNKQERNFVGVRRI